MAAVIGIDLGTTTSEICAFRNGKPEVIKNLKVRGEKLITPSVVGLNPKSKQLIVGAEAEGLNENVIIEIKRKMGERTKVRLGDNEFSPEEISSMILKYLKDYAEESLHEKIAEVVITVPANFPIEARKATEIAAELAGLKVLRIIQEPTAAALAFGFDKEADQSKVLVYDLGGGTFDVSIVEIFNGVVDVIAHDGNRHLGGADFDQVLVNYVIEYLEKEKRLLDIDSKTKHRIKLECKRVKEELTYSAVVNLNIPFIGVVRNEPVNLDIDISRAKFEDLTFHLVDRTMNCIESALKSGKLNKSQIDKVILVGGATRMPIIKKRVKEFFGFEPNTGIEPDLAVSMGAAIQAGIIKGASDTIIMDKVVYGFGVRTVQIIGEQYIPDSYSEIIPPQAQMNTEYHDEFSTIHDEQSELEVMVYQREINNKSRNVNDMIPVGVPTLISDLPAIKGELQEIKISMCYNLNGLINVKAYVVSTGEVKEWEINTASAVNANATSVETKEKLEKIWMHSKYADKAKSLINATESRLSLMEQENKKEAIRLLEELKMALVNEELNKIDDLIDKLTDILINY